MACSGKSELPESTERVRKNHTQLKTKPFFSNMQESHHNAKEDDRATLIDSNRSPGHLTPS